MKYLAVFFLFCFLLVPAFTQTTESKTKKAAASTAVKKPTPKKTTSSAKPKATTAKTHTAATKPAPAKTGTASKPKATTTAAKTGSNSAKKPSTAKSATAKPKAVPDEKAEYEKAVAVTDAAERVVALRKFLTAFPASERKAAAAELIVSAYAEIGNAGLQVGDMPAAVAAFTQAARDTPKPVSDQLFSATLAPIPANLFFRGERAGAFEIAKILEEKCDASASQLLGIAGFYMSIENGSEARRVSNAAIALDPNSSAAYQTLGLADRMDFQLEGSAAAYAKALELDPESISARRGLAEMKRALGKPEEALDLYNQILAKDPTNSAAQTGSVFSLFDSGKREEAETQMNTALAANPGNIMLLAGAGYWYAAHNEGQKAVETAQKAIAAEPRFIWSYIALARGYLALQMPQEAEKTLLAARRYGNFPTLDYEIASARAMAGLYREAAEALSEKFEVKDGVVSTNLGGRVLRESSDFTELVSLERRASIAEPIAADSPENASQLRALLDLWTKLKADGSDADALGKAADEFVRGEDKMKTHRQLFAAQELLGRKKNLPKVIELTKGATGNAEAAVDVPSPSTAVMADELYDSRRLAISKDEFIKVPDVPRATLLAILRGRIEDLNGWALYQSENTPESIIHLKRAVSVLPEGSAWLRNSAWRLGSALESEGKGPEALEAYVKSYKSGQPDAVKYSIIAALYKRLNGSSDGLAARVGPDPAAPPPEPVAKRPEPTPVPERTPDALPVARKVEPTPESTPVPTKVEPTPESTPALAEPTPAPTPEPSPTPAKVEPTPEPSPSPEVQPTKPEPTPEPSATPAKVEPTPEPSPSPTKAEPTPEQSPAPVKVEPTPEQTPAKAEPTPEPTATPAKVEPTPEPTPAKVEPTPEPSPTTEAPITKPERTPEPSPTPAKTEPTPVPKPDDSNVAIVKEPSVSPTKELFPPVIITIPPPGKDAKPSKDEKPAAEPATDPATSKAADDPKPVEPKPENNPDAKPGAVAESRPRVVETPAEPTPCTLTLSEESLSLENNGGELAVIVGLADDREISGIKAETKSPKEIQVRLEPISAVRGRALFVVRSVGTTPGVYQVTFILPCGKKDLTVKVR